MFCCVILFYLFFHLKSLVTIATLKQLIVSLRMEEQFIRNVTPAKYVFISDFLKKLDVGRWPCKRFIYRARCQGNLSCNVVASKQQLKSVILDNKESSTGFLM